MPREINLEKNRVYVSTPMIHELIPLIPMHEHTIPTFEVGSSSTSPNENEVPII
jgi:hypothetical protein